MTALVVTYHGVGPHAPLELPADVLAAHLDVIAEEATVVLTMSELAARLRSGGPPQRAVAITFDDGLASAVSIGGQLLAERDLRATFFCVAGRLGGTSDWPSAPADAPCLPLATADELKALAAAGHELGAHGFEHAPLVGDDPDELRRELVGARDSLREATGAAATSLAYPYGAGPSPAARALVERSYGAACTTVLATVSASTDPYAIPRVDAHYLRRPELLRRAIRGGLGPYLGARRLGAKARRALRPDYAEAGQ